MSSTPVPKRLVELVGQSEFWATALRKESGRLDSRGRVFGIPVIFVTTVTGAATFTQLNSSPATWAKALFGSVNLLAAALSAVQTYVAFPVRAQKAKSSGEKFGKLFGQMLDAEDRIEGGQDVPQQAELRALYAQYEELKSARPSVSQWAQKQASEELKEKAQRPQH